jgi:hypothetical protein
LETVYEIVDGTRYSSFAAAEKLPRRAIVSTVRRASRLSLSMCG